jgi:hypothetical protein
MILTLTIYNFFIATNALSDSYRIGTNKANPNKKISEHSWHK